MKGYKAFNKDMLAMNNIKFEIGKQMHIDGPIKAGPIDGNGFHFLLILKIHLDMFRLKVTFFYVK